MNEKFISKNRIKFNEIYSNSSETDLLKEILYKIEEDYVLQKTIKEEMVKIKKNTFNIFLIILLPMILSALIYAYLLFVI